MTAPSCPVPGDVLAREIAREAGIPDDDPRAARALDVLLAGLSEHGRYPEALAAIEAGAGPDIARALRQLAARFGDVAAAVPRRLGACPAVVFRTLSLLRTPNAGFHDIEKVCNCDPVIAASLLRYANSALFSHAPIRGVAPAIAYLGVEDSKRVVLSAAAKPMLASAALPQLWEHSVDVAVIAEQIASAGHAVDPSEAFVAGLIHDMGRIALHLHDVDALANAHRRFSASPYCAVAADYVFTGADHGEMGAAVLSHWNLPPELLEAVRHHHRPEQHASPLASVLYLAEEVSHSLEDFPHPARLAAALRTAKVPSLNMFTSDLRRLGAALAMMG
ncbi:MAG: HDOD domain-containing protein [Bryobacteraceae bacterium]|nr:HDOD domain-containing protein [Bryobacteraceae bacterium]